MVGKKIKKILRDRDLKQIDLIKYVINKSEVTQAERTRWSRYLNDKQEIPYKDLKKVAQFLGVDVNYLLTDLTDTPNTQSIIANAPIIHNSPNSHISINDAINSLPPEVGTLVKYMMKLDENKRIDFINCVFRNCGRIKE